MKIVSADILHKTEAGGVLVGLKSADEVSKGYDIFRDHEDGCVKVVLKPGE